MGNFIKYKRFTKEFGDEEKIQEFLDELITDGWEIVYYYERPKDLKTLSIIVIAGKNRKEVL
jgi:hypothetical protein